MGVASSFVNVTVAPAVTLPHDGTNRFPETIRTGPVTAVAVAEVHVAGGGAAEPP
jgi:hypothetical protein